MNRLRCILPLLAMVFVAGAANADTCGKGRISGVSPASSTMSGPNQFWNVAPGSLVTVTLTGCTEVTGSSIQVIVQSTATGNYCTTATGGSGTYSFAYQVPLNFCQTAIVSYGTKSCSPATGYKANDALGKCPGHLRGADGSGNNCTPTVTGCANKDLGCNPPVLPTCANAQTLGGYTVVGGTSCGSSLPVNCSAGTVQSNGCNRSQTFTYSVSNACGQSASCSSTFTWKIVTLPVLSGVPTGSDLGCNPTPPSCATVTASDECGSVDVTCTPGDVKSNGCLKSQKFTYAATNCAGTNSQDVTYTWTVVTAPTLANCGQTYDLGCNPNATPTCDTYASAPFSDGAVTASNECGSVPVTCSAGDVTSNGCSRQLILTFSAVGCDPKLTSTCTRTYNWTVATTPVFDDCTPGTELGCNPKNIPTCATADAVHAHNECGPVDVTCDDGTDQVNGCVHTRTLTYTATGCGLQNTCTRVYTWEVVTAPVFDNCDTGTTDLGCNPANIPGCDDKVTAHDECGGVFVSCDPGIDTGDNCNGNTRLVTYTATNCAGTTTCVKTYKWTIVGINLSQPDDCTVCPKATPADILANCPIPIASDTCGNPITLENGGLSYTDTAPGPLDPTKAVCGFGFIRTWTATSLVCPGATKSVTQTINVCTSEACGGGGGGGCTLTLGFWKNHGPANCHSGNNINAWPSTTVNLGFATFNTGDPTQAAALCDILSASGQSLCAQLIAAQLNIANGADGTVVQSTIADAIACLALNGNSCGDPQSPCKQYTDQLDAFNQGLIGPGHCKD